MITGHRVKGKLTFDTIFLYIVLKNVYFNILWLLWGQSCHIFTVVAYNLAFLLTRWPFRPQNNDDFQPNLCVLSKWVTCPRNCDVSVVNFWTWNCQFFYGNAFNDALFDRRGLFLLQLEQCIFTGWSDLAQSNVWGKISWNQCAI